MSATRQYRGVNIHRNEGGYKLRYWALTAQGQLTANTLEEMRELIREQQKQNDRKGESK